MSIPFRWMHPYYKMDPYLIEKLQTLRTMGQKSARRFYHSMKIPVLIRWKTSFHESFQTLSSIYHRSQIHLCHFYPEIQTSFVYATPEQLDRLIRLPTVKRIFYNRRIRNCLHIASRTIRAPCVWKTQNLGQGATIAILDTGIEPHPDLGSRIIGFYDCIAHRTMPYDDNGHGSHVAGCAAGDGSQSNGLFRGIAPQAKLVGIKALGRTGESDLTDVIEGIYWCIAHQKEQNIRVLSLSLGYPSECSYQDDPLCMMAELAWKKGIVVVTSAGNAGPIAQTITSPGNHPRIITVGASNDQRTFDHQDDQVAPFSSRGPTLDGLSKPDILAPGTQIISLRSPYSYLDQLLPHCRINQHYFLLSGTSMATPLVAGTVALLLTRFPRLTPDQVKKHLLRSATNLAYPVNAQGYGQIDAWRALSSCA